MIWLGAKTCAAAKFLKKRSAIKSEIGRFETGRMSWKVVIGNGFNFGEKGATGFCCCKMASKISSNDINFSRQGYFEFSETHQCSYPGVFRLTGFAPHHRFIRLEENTAFNVPPTATLDWQNGGVEYDRGSSISMKSGAHSLFPSIRFFGTTQNEGVALEGLEQPLNIVGGAGTTVVNHSVFERYSQPPVFSGRLYVRLLNEIKFLRARRLLK